MKLWIFNHYAIGPGSSGGTRHYDLAKVLVNKGFEVTIFASSFNHQAGKELQSYEPHEQFKIESFDGVRFVWIKTLGYKQNNWRRVVNMISYGWKVLRISTQLSEKPDVIIGSIVHPIAAWAGYVAAKRKKSIFYFEERDLWPQTIIDLGKISEKNPLVAIMRYLEKFLYKKAKKIIVLFENAVQYVIQQGIDSDKVVCLPNGADLNRYSGNVDYLPEQTQKVLAELKEKFIAVYTGAHGMANNLDAILDAAKKVKEANGHIHFLLVGDGPEKERLKNRQTMEQISNVTFLDPVPKECIPVLLARVRVGLLPLVDSPVFKWGISPNKLFDYMASSIPVILLCNLEGTPVEKSGGGIVIKQAFSDSLASHLLELQAQPEIVRLMGEKAKEYVANKHSWNHLGNELATILETDIKANVTEVSTR